MGTHGAEGTPGMFAWMNDRNAADDATAIALALKLDSTTASSTYGPQSLGSIAAVGSSITANNITAGMKDNKGYLNWATALLGQRLYFPNGNVIGYPGYGSAYMVSDGLPALLALTPRPGWVVLEPGVVNDINSGVTLASFQASIDAFVSGAMAAGIRVVVTTGTPNGTGVWSGAQAQMLHTMNHWLCDYALTRRGVILCDWSKYIIDPATGFLATNYDIDLVHPSWIGAYWMGKALAEALSPVVPAVDLIPATNIATLDSLLANGRMVGDTAGVATGWAATSSGTITRSKVARTDGVPGEWQRLSQSADAGIWGINSELVWSTPGAVVYGLVEIIPGAGFDGCKGLDLMVQEGGAGAANDLYTIAGETNALGTIPGRLTLRTPPFTVSGAAAWMNLTVLFWGTGTFDIAWAKFATV